ncbi:hypothetical protein CPB84DRAFT_1749043 [Gymnopilus junonius]|uniref:Uncharacterized protein n=1 Tax=Gymnopilus junonius TaxID=109634 RepID=A0A9P5NKH5_GYMJU|nr:hypothetical protein CPB84DRAFT_1749043 [Gymnopilus junonius]
MDCAFAGEKERKTAPKRAIRKKNKNMTKTMCGQPSIGQDLEHTRTVLWRIRIAMRGTCLGKVKLAWEQKKFHRRGKGGNERVHENENGNKERLNVERRKLTRSQTWAGGRSIEEAKVLELLLEVVEDALVDEVEVSEVGDEVLEVEVSDVDPPGPEGVTEKRDWELAVLEREAGEAEDEPEREAGDEMEPPAAEVATDIIGEKRKRRGD